MLKELKLTCACRRTFGTLDTSSDGRSDPSLRRPLAEDMAAHMYKNTKEFACALHMRAAQGIVQ